MTTTATLLRAYAKALDEARTRAELRDRNEDFIADNRLWTPNDARAAIYAAHLARVKGEGSPSACDAALREALSQTGVL